MPCGVASLEGLVRGVQWLEDERLWWIPERRGGGTAGGGLDAERRERGR